MTNLEQIEKYILTEVAVNFDKKSLALDEDLLDQRILDSLGVMKLVMFLEQTFGIQIEDEDIIPENFQTLNRTAQFVEQKMNTK